MKAAGIVGALVVCVVAVAVYLSFRTPARRDAMARRGDHISPILRKVTGHSVREERAIGCSSSAMSTPARLG
jgi:hypothetical protein